MFVPNCHLNVVADLIGHFEEDVAGSEQSGFEPRLRVLTDRGACEALRVASAPQILLIHFRN